MHSDYLVCMLFILLGKIKTNQKRKKERERERKEGRKEGMKQRRKKNKTTTSV